LVFECPICFSLVRNYDRPEAMCQASLTRTFTAQLRVEIAPWKTFYFYWRFLVGRGWWGERPREPLSPISALFQQPPCHDLIW